MLRDSNNNLTRIMAQPNTHEQLSIQEVPNILKISRQNAALGLYAESIRSYRHALHVMTQHVQTVSDPFLREQWKKADEEVKTEIQGIYKLYKALKVLRGEASSSKEISWPSDIAPAPEERPIKPAQQVAPSQPRSGKPPPSVVERFGGVPFSRKEEQAGQFGVKDGRREEPAPVYQMQQQEPRKDPLIWDPPSPKNYQAPPKKAMVQKKLPKWMQPNQPKPPAKHAKNAK